MKKKNDYWSGLRIAGLGAGFIGLYAIWRWHQSQQMVDLLLGYLKAHVQYHKDNGIPFGPGDDV